MPHQFARAPATGEGWRSRAMAPVYALVLAFVFVLLAWAVLPGSGDGDNGPVDREPDTPTLLATFGLAGGDELPEELQEVPASIVTKDSTEHDAGTLGETGEVHGSDLAQVAWICLQLPDGWRLPSGAVEDGKSCVKPGTKAELSKKPKGGGG